MSQLLSRKNFMINLCERGIPARYAWRVSKELNDHATDMADHQSESNLGDPVKLLNDFETAYKQRTFGGRHPLLTFLMLPLPMVVSIYILSLVSAFLLANLIYALCLPFGIEKMFREDILLTFVLFVSMISMPNLLSTIFIFKWARKSGVNFKYAILCCLPVLLMAIIFTTTTSISQFDGGLNCGFGFNLPAGRWFGPAFGPPEQAWPLPGFYQIMQFTISVLVIFYLIHHEKVKQHRLTEKLVAEE